MQLLIRFLAGGAIVSLFCLIADVVRPKSVAGLFGAAPSVALATLALTIVSHGKPYAAIETKAMIAGGVAFVFYAIACLQLMTRARMRAKPAAFAAIVVWFAVALGGWWAFLR